MATPEQEEASHRALRQACSILEQARCIEAEREACELLSASLLQYQSQPEIHLSSIPQGIHDAWIAFSEVSSKNIVTNEEKPLALPQGQVGAALHTRILSQSLQHTAELASRTQTDRLTEGKSLEDARKIAYAAPPETWLHFVDQRVAQIKEYHARHDTASNDNNTNNVSNKRPKLVSAQGYDLHSFVTSIAQPVIDETLFTAEEVLGKYLDLQALYDQALAHLRSIFEKDPFLYADFLESLAAGLYTLKEANKLNERKKYVRFLASLQEYLESFVRRTTPLVDLVDLLGPATKAFEDEWGKKGGCKGWESKPAEAILVKVCDEDGAAPCIDLSKYRSAKELEELVDANLLKAELARLGLKCGGTPADRAQRLFLTKNTSIDQLPAKLFAKKNEESENGYAKNERRVDIARRESMITALIGHLRPTLEATIRRTERRQTQTLAEREKEVQEDVHGFTFEQPKKKNESESDEEGEEPIYNPKNVPLDWDGKPIPYWLFKLHGLNHYHDCEICGGESYRGRRNFELHFGEQKHALGMKSLGIPNTKHFHGVTKIEDAQELWKALQEKLQREQFDNAKEEEYEDSHGNVLSRSTYTDLARQGLL